MPMLTKCCNCSFHSYLFRRLSIYLQWLVSTVVFNNFAVVVVVLIEVMAVPRVSHTKASVIGSTITIPITNGKLNLGTWQGIYLTEVCCYYYLSQSDALPLAKIWSLVPELCSYTSHRGHHTVSTNSYGYTEKKFTQRDLLFIHRFKTVSSIDAYANVAFLLWSLVRLFTRHSRSLEAN